MWYLEFCVNANYFEWQDNDDTFTKDKIGG